jgi:alpha-glucosidase
MRTNDNYTTINVEAQQDDPESVLNFYRKAIGVRKQRASLLGRGEFRLLEEEDEKMFKFIKIAEGGEKAFVVLNFTAEEQTYEVPQEVGNVEAVLDTRADGNKGTLKPYEGRLYVSAQ